MTKNNVACVVVLYNPAKGILKNIFSYLEQVQYILIIDNSENEDLSISEFSKVNSSVEYIFNNTNIGVAAALNMGARKAIEKGFLYLLTMDQDSIAPPNLVQKLLEAAQSDKKVGIVSPLHSNKFGTHLKSNKYNGIEKVMSVMTSGNLLSLEVYKQIGPFCDEFFIDYVDVEYCMRLNYKNYFVLQLNDIILKHNEANLSEKVLFSKKFYPPNNTPFRLYYKTRNLLYLRDKFRKMYPQLLKQEYSLYFRNLVKILLFEENKFLKAKMIITGIWDYFQKKKGRKF